MSASRRETLTALAALAAAAPFAPAWAQDAGSPFAGTYEGVLQAGSVALRIRLEIRDDLTATGTSLDQGSAQFQSASVKIDGNRIVIEFPAIGATYTAARSQAGGLDGTFTQRGVPQPLAMARVAAVRVEPLPAGALTAERLSALRMRTGTPGMAAGWMRKGKRAVVLADGLRVASGASQVSPSDAWHLGSVTKSMTALLAARAVEAGVLGWDSTVSAVLGKTVSGIHSNFASVSLLHLLCHNSGLPTGAGEATLGLYAPLPGRDIMAERQRFAATVLTAPPASRPGARMAYSNANYLVVGAMLEAVLERPWEALIRDQLFRPLRLDSAGIGNPPGAQPVGHAISAGRRIPVRSDIPAVLGPAGLTHMNIADLLRYLAAHRDAAPRLLSKASWRMLHTAHFTGSNAAPGWFVLPGGGLMHLGSNGYWASLVQIDPRTKSVSAFAGNDIAAQAETEWLLAALNTAAAKG